MEQNSIDACSLKLDKVVQQLTNIEKKVDGLNSTSYSGGESVLVAFLVGAVISFFIGRFLQFNKLRESTYKRRVGE